MSETVLQAKRQAYWSTELARRLPGLFYLTDRARAVWEAQDAIAGRIPWPPLDRFGRIRWDEEQQLYQALHREADLLSATLEELGQRQTWLELAAQLIHATDVGSEVVVAPFSPHRELVADERFAGDAGMDPDRTPKPVAARLGSGGFLTLAYRPESLVRPDWSELERTSTLYPGDWRRVERLLGRWHAPGASGVFHDLGAMSDGKPSMYVVFETFRLHPSERSAASPLSLEGDLRAFAAGPPPYRAVIRWGYERSVSVSMVVVTQGPGRFPGVLERLELMKEDGSWVVFAPHRELDRPIFFGLGTERIRQGRMVVAQSRSEPAYLGVTRKLLPNGASELAAVGRMSALGFSVDAATGVLRFPRYPYRPDIARSYDQFVPPALQAALQGVRAERYSVSLQDVLAGELRFEPRSFWVSRPYRLPDRVRGLWVEIDAKVPYVFGPGRFVGAAVSFDDGQTWITVDPDAPARLPIPLGASQVRLRLELRRPDDDRYQTYSPVVEGARVWLIR